MTEDKKISLFREWLDDRKRIYATSQCHDAVIVLNSIINMYDCIFDCNKTFLEVEESDSEKIRKGIIALVDFALRDGSAIAPGFNETKEQALAWLREQNEQQWSKDDKEMVDYLIRCCEKEHKELCNDRYGHQDIVSDLKEDCRKKWDWLKILKQRIEQQLQGKTALEAIHEEKVDNTNKIEPKFKIRDWIIGDDGVFQITNYERDHGYELTNSAGFVSHFVSPDYVSTKYRLWTIRDAKDGDILLSKYNQPFIYNGTYNEESVGAYGGMTISGEEFLKSCLPNNWTSKEGVKPAIKEQRALLFETMREAGYTWDADKNELKKKLQ